jgi:hypothetical protein
MQLHVHSCTLLHTALVPQDVKTVCQLLKSQQAELRVQVRSIPTCTLQQCTELLAVPAQYRRPVQ